MRRTYSPLHTSVGRIKQHRRRPVAVQLWVSFPNKISIIIGKRSMVGISNIFSNDPVALANWIGRNKRQRKSSRTEFSSFVHCCNTRLHRLFYVIDHREVDYVYTVIPNRMPLGTGPWLQLIWAPCLSLDVRQESSLHTCDQFLDTVACNLENLLLKVWGEM